MVSVVTALRRFGKPAALMTGATGVAAVCSLLALGVNARALGAGDFGRLALVQAFVSFVSGLTTFDNWQPVVRLALRLPRRMGLVLGAGVTLDVCASIVAATVASVCLLGLNGRFGYGPGSGLALMAYSLSLLAGVGGTPKGYFRLQGRFDLLAQNQVFAALLQLAAAIALWALHAGLSTYLLVLGVLSAYPGASLFVRLLRALRRENIRLVNPLIFRSGRRYLKTFLKVAAGNSVLSTLATSRHQVAMFIVSSIAGAAAAGLYAVAFRCANALTRFLVPLNQLIFPEMMRMATNRRPEEVRRSLGRMFVLAVIVILPTSAAAGLFSRTVVSLTAGQDFLGAAPIFALLLTGELLLWASFSFGPVILHAWGQRPLLGINLAVAVLANGLCVYLAWRFGAVGAGVGMLAGAVLTFAALFGFALRATRKPALRKAEAAVG